MQTRLTSILAELLLLFAYFVPLLQSRATATCSSATDMDRMDEMDEMGAMDESSCYPTVSRIALFPSIKHSEQCWLSQ